MIHYIIDGNNLIGKIVSLKNLPDKQIAREKLALMLERFFAGKKLKVSLHFDGYENEPIRISGIKIKYSLNRSADEMIKEEIEKIKNQKSVFVVSSDLEILSYAKVCGCNVQKSEEFYHQMLIQDNKNKEDEKPSDFDTDEFKKLFGIE
ncbi:MAG: NYN domain-containing protein [Ignavibacterium album]|jgi:predicted RNA-binding protein with PIN domain|uniref:NYN domain-containing protein n=1 Tax=Ignavibacterium album TaxID=591197 RepID=UPI0026F0FD8A|nr:NYN domain-containing protein [Ignavibacterium album]MCX8105933.1 NYN domain-containing protein [Ignavibacterium album]